MIFNVFHLYLNKYPARLTGFYFINDNKVAVALVLKFCPDHSRCDTMQQQV